MDYYSITKIKPEISKGNLDLLKKSILHKNDINFNLLKNINRDDILFFFEEIIFAVQNDLGYSYKYKRYYDFYDKIIDIFLKVYINDTKKKGKKSYNYLVTSYLPDDDSLETASFRGRFKRVLAIILMSISSISGGEKILKKMKLIFSKTDIINNLSKSSLSGTITTFIFWEGKLIDYLNKNNLDHTKMKEMIDLKKLIFVNSFGNTDDRVYKHLLKYSNNGKFYDCILNNEENITKILSMSNSFYIPKKYVLKRIKNLYNKFGTNKNFALYVLRSVTSINIFLTLSRYYYLYNDYNLLKIIQYHGYYDILYILCNNIIETYYNPDINKIEKSLNYVKKLFNIVKTNEEKNMILLNIYSILAISNNFKFDYNSENSLILENKSLNFFEKNNMHLIKLNNNNYILENIESIRILSDYLYNSNIKFNIIIKKIIVFLSKCNILNLWIKNLFLKKKCYLKSFDKLLPLIPYLDYFILLPQVNLENSNKISQLIMNKYRLIMINRFIFNMKIFIKRVNKMKVKIRKLKLYNVVKGLNNLFSNNLSLQKFNKIPPYLLHIGEIDILKNKSLYIREKADGILIKQMPMYCYPNIEIIINTKIKGEFKENDELILVFDIALPDMSIKDRYKYLRSIHPFTKSLDNNIIVDSFEKMKQVFNEDRKNLMKFMKEAYDGYRWYPKLSIEVLNMSENFKNDIINNIIEEEDYFLGNEYDGLIITPLDGSREIKIKPKKFLTLDLLYENNKWLDCDNNNWSEIIKVNDIELEDGFIYRCYPIGKNIFEPKDIRYDKKFPNNYNIVNITIKAYNFNWKTKINNNFYYHKKIISSKEWTQIKNKQNNILTNMISKLNPKNNSTWIDMGSGFSKLLNYIKIYYPKKYIGIDIDINCIINSIHKYSKNIGTKNIFFPSDLSKDWNKYKFSWYTLNKNDKVNYIICNFSIAHFFIKKFWEQLNEISKKGTKMLFNVVNKKAYNKINISNSYLYLDKETNKVKYLFDTHKYEMSEEYISEEKILIFMKNFGWNILEKFNVDDKSLVGYYTWYIIEKQ